MVVDDFLTLNLHKAMTPIYLLIDADSIVYNATMCSKLESDDGWVHDIEQAKWKFDETYHNIVNTLADKYQMDVIRVQMFIGGENNFRKFISPSYKSSRKLKQRPPLLSDIMTYSEEQHAAIVCHGVEADDALATAVFNLRGSEYNVVFASLDKDTTQIEGVRFDYYFQRMELTVISKEDAERNLWRQVLIGDKTDDIRGVDGVGDKRAFTIISGKSGWALRRAVAQAYVKKYHDKGFDRLRLAYSLIKLRTNVSLPEGIYF